jgi:hypothetical protein
VAQWRHDRGAAHDYAQRHAQLDTMLSLADTIMADRPLMNNDCRWMQKRPDWSAAHD